MLQSIVINTTIYLIPSELDDIYHNIITKIKNNTACTEEYGYPIEFEEMIKYSSKSISTTGSCVFNVSYRIKCLKPVINQVYNCIVTHIYPEGIFASYGKLRILVPSSNISEYIYDGTLVKIHDSTIKTDDNIDIIITQLKYDNHNYQCIGKLT